MMSLAAPICLAANDPVEQSAPIKRVFVPLGFDDNDMAEVIIQGEFPTSCFRVGQSGFDVDLDQKRIDVWATAYEYGSDVCAEVRTSFIIPLKVGILKEGTYEIRLRGLPEIVAQLQVGQAVTDSPDDFLYAPVEGANVSFDPRTGQQTLQIFGRFPLPKRGCLALDNVKLNPVVNNVLVVQPIMVQLDGDQCNGRSNAFDVSIPLVTPLKGDLLIHIRSINGNAYNRFVSFGE
jgi:hypothetical protein